mmetsp:Transcript_26344/g.39909  ORF Transcript_26344/g.39909 Transcript_26344/m.39909 type:complete len:207 (-) Transcript_26344:77-697(-)
MNTRAASASLHRRNKQELVRLLFGGGNYENSLTASKLADAMKYTYSDLKKAYLDRVQVVHPDKLKNTEDSSEDRKAKHEHFVELKKAWDSYSILGKIMPKNGNPTESNFTMFGVGCSFSDSPEERARREEITNQACRGWFSTGALEERASTSINSTEHSNSSDKISLCDDNLFVESNEECCRESDLSATSEKAVKPSLAVGGSRRR